MSSLHISLDGSGSHDQRNGNITRGSLSQSDDTSSLDTNVPRHVASLSLSLSQEEASPDTEGDSSQDVTDAASDPPSTPPTPASGSITSFDFERNSLSDQLSSLSPQPSLYSLTESLKESAIRREYGRAVNTHSDVYKLAADEEEAERLDRQHHLYKFVFGDYVPPFREVLEDNNDPLRPKACLDIGCGSGAWILDVAHTFPHVYCTAVDLVPLPAIIPSLIERTQIPSNLRFEIDDVSLGLEHFAGDFDVVHVQHISSGIRDYYRLIDDTALALRPHGLADFTECDWRVYDVEKRAIISTANEIWGSFEPPEGWTGTGMARSGTSPVHRSTKATASEPSPFVARFMTLTRQAVRRRGGHVDAAALLHRWISEHPAYEEVVYREAWLPIRDWLDNIDAQKHSSIDSMSKEEIERFRWIGKEMAHDMLEFFRSVRPLLLGSGVPEALVDFLAEKASEEIREERRQDAIVLFNT